MHAESPHLFIDRRDWSFRRQGKADEERHNEKVKEAIKGNLEHIISDGSIITADPQTKKIVRVPVRSLDIPHIRYKDGNQGIGSGSGEEGAGDIIGRRPIPGTGQGPGAGDQPGVEYYEAELSLEEIQAMVFADLGLPNLKPKPKDQMQSEEVVFDDLRKLRKPTLIDIERTILENMARNAREHGVAELRDISPEDYINRTWNEKVKEQNAAVLFLKRDISASMGPNEIYLSRAFAWWTVNFLKTQYPKVDIVFISHDTEAYQSDEEHFFQRGNGGGTKCSTALELQMDQIKKLYSPEQYNIYGLHFSDGDNWGDDDSKCSTLVQKMLDIGINQYSFIQVGRAQESALMTNYKRKIKDERFTSLVISKKEEVLPALKKVFPSEESLSKTA